MYPWSYTQRCVSSLIPVLMELSIRMNHHRWKCKGEPLVRHKPNLRCNLAKSGERPQTHGLVLDAWASLNEVKDPSWNLWDSCRSDGHSAHQDRECIYGPAHIPPMWNHEKQEAFTCKMSSEVYLCPWHWRNSRKQETGVLSTTFQYRQTNEVYISLSSAQLLNLTTARMCHWST